jgi:hypothetical protein
MEITKDKDNSFLISTKQADVVINPTDNSKAEVVLFSDKNSSYKPVEGQIVFDSAGEYEVKNTMIDAVACDKSTSFVVTAGDIRTSFLDIETPNLSEQQIEELGGVDILIIKFAVEKVETLTKLIGELEPSIVIPFDYSVEQLKQLSAEFGKEVSTMPKLKIAKKDINPEDQQLVVLE